MNSRLEAAVSCGHQHLCTHSVAVNSPFEAAAQLPSAYPEQTFLFVGSTWNSLDRLRNRIRSISSSTCCWGFKVDADQDENRPRKKFLPHTVFAPGTANCYLLADLQLEQIRNEEVDIFTAPAIESLTVVLFDVPSERCQAAVELEFQTKLLVLKPPE